jgi:hypothetical protein
VLEQLIVSGAGGSGFDFLRPSVLKTRLVLNWSDADARPSLAHLTQIAFLIQTPIRSRLTSGVHPTRYSQSSLRRKYT